MGILILATPLLLAAAPADAAGEPPAVPPIVTSAPTPPAPAPAPAVEGSGDIGETVVNGIDRSSPADPLSAVNVTTFKVSEAVEGAVIEPVVQGYNKGVPHPVRSGITHFLNNLDEPIVFLNFLLQLKPGKAGATLVRFSVNSTVGLGGLLDVAKAKPFNLSRRSNGFADTLGYYGVKPGPFLFLPGIGSTTVRDMLGRMVDLALLPTAVGAPFNRPQFSLPVRTLSALDERAEMDAQFTKLKEESPDSYVAVREFYLKRRAAEIAELKGKPKTPKADAAKAESPAP